MNNLDTQTVKGIVGEKFLFLQSNRKFLGIRRRSTEEVDGIKAF